jgi:hypothetical protein
VIQTLRLRRGPHDLAVDPRAARVAVTELSGAGRSEVLLYDITHPARAPQRLFSGRGEFDGIAWSPDARWLLVGWPIANQWLFLRTGVRPRLLAVSNIARQFESSEFPSVGTWCC